MAVGTTRRCAPRRPALLAARRGPDSMIASHAMTLRTDGGAAPGRLPRGPAPRRIDDSHASSCMIRVPAGALPAVVCAASGGGQAPRPSADELAPPPPSAGGAYSPSGDRHPGILTYEDHVEHRTWTRHALEVPATIAWVKVGDRWRPVVWIEIQGNAQQREITTYGPDHEI